MFKGLILLCIFAYGVNAQQSYQGAARDKHNQYRSKHQAGPLVLDNALNLAAVKCARYYANKKTIDHSCPHKNKAGENLFASSGSRDTNSLAAVAATNLWYNEVSKYNYNNPGFSAATGHFTQLVWKSSKTLGIGYAKNSTFAVVVALYSPAGNIIGNNNQYFRTNVLPPK